MKHALYIDQLTLEFWAGRKLNPTRTEIQGADRERFLNHVLDVEDAFLIAFISDLNPHDEAVKGIMWQDHFLVKLRWLKGRLPLLQMSEQSLYRRLRWLRLMGILKCVTRTVDGNKTLAYYRMSALFWKIRAKRHAKAASAARKVRAVIHEEHGPIVPAEHGSPKSHSPCGHEPYSAGTSKAIQDSQYSTPPEPALPDGALAAPPAAAPIDGEAAAKQAFGQLRQICQIRDDFQPREGESKAEREQRIKAKRKLLAEQVKHLEAIGQLELVDPGGGPPITEGQIATGGEHESVG